MNSTAARTPDALTGPFVQAATCLLLFACGNAPRGDLDAGPVEHGSARSGDSRRNDGGADGGMDGGTDGGAMGVDPSLATCAPCDRVPSSHNGWERCCAGPAGDACGLTRDGIDGCFFPCTADADCDEYGVNFACADQAGSFCVRRCLSSEDCGDSTRSCTLRNNLALKRVDALCLEGATGGTLGQPCSLASDCRSGVCTPSADQTGRCSRLCDTDAHCEAPMPRCIGVQISDPSGTSRQRYGACLE